MKKPTTVLATFVVGCAALLALGAHVRADAPPGHFSYLGGVRDNATGLVWQLDFSAGVQTQAAAITYCAGLTVGGGGWRLPAISELQTIVDETTRWPAIDQSYFPGTPSERFWSASSVAGQPTNGWDVDFSDGLAFIRDRTDSSRARCVR